MKKFALAALIGLLFSQLAQAEIVTFQYTAKITGLEEAATAVGMGDHVAVQSSTIAGGLLSIGDTFTGTIRYDTAAQTSSEFHAGGFDGLSYNDMAGLNLTAHFASAGINFNTTDYVGAQINHFPAGLGYTDAVFLNGYHYGTDSHGNTTLEYMYFNFTDPTNSKFTGTPPGAELLGYDRTTTDLFGTAIYPVDYEFGSETSEQRVYVLGAMTDLRLAAAVPEPETYAMLLAGLGLLGWRRSKAIRG